MIYVYAKYQKPTPYIKRDIANVKVFTSPAGPTESPLHRLTLHCMRVNENNENFLVGHICFEGPPFFLNNPKIILLG